MWIFYFTTQQNYVEKKETRKPTEKEYGNDILLLLRVKASIIFVWEFAGAGDAHKDELNLLRIKVQI